MNEDEVEDSLLDGAMIMDPEEVDHLQSEAFNAGYRRAIEFVKKSIEKGELNSDTIVEKMMKDWWSW